MWFILNLQNFESEYFKTLSALVRKYNFTESTVRNKWAKATKEMQENEVFIVIGNYRISKIKIQE